MKEEITGLGKRNKKNSSKKKGGAKVKVSTPSIRKMGSRKGGLVQKGKSHTDETGIFAQGSRRQCGKRKGSGSFQGIIAGC